jgi:uncharacterized protein YcfJ
MRTHSINTAFKLHRVLLMLAFAAPTFAGTAPANHQYIDSARVVSVSPQTETVNVPRHECRTAFPLQSDSHPNHSIVGAVIGGVAGGLLGNTIG